MTSCPILPPMPLNGLSLDLGGAWRYSQPLGDGFPEAPLPEGLALSVPGEIVLQGLPFDPALDAGLETRVEVPESWFGHAMRLRFGAVYSACEVFLDGQQVGAHLGGFTAFDIDLSQHLRAGQAHRLTLRLRNGSVADEIGFMSRYADHPLAGILRAVTLYAVPQAHLAALRVATLFDLGPEAARLRVELEANAPVTVRLRLTDPGGVIVGDWRASAPGTSDFQVRAPRLWHPEHPDLYTLTVEIDGATYRRLVGFREVAVRDRRLCLNGRPILLRGVNHHETHPLTGRADTARWAEVDVRAFKAAHVNFIRTSHYPPTPELLEACDRLGMLVEVENAVCFAFGQFEYTKRWDDWGPDEQVAISDYIVTGALEMVAEHGHHPSVILWSVANESQWAPPFEAAAAAIRQDDPTRPRTFNWFKHGPECRDHVEVANHHYPEAGEVARFDVEPRPVLFGEFAHLYCYNDRELLTDPGLRGQWAGFLAMQWEEIRSLPNAAGGAIWAAIDDWFLLPQLDGSRRGVGYGSWGPLDGWRRAKPELEGMARAWDPIHLPDRALRAEAPIRLPVENRCDAIDLEAFTVTWEIGQANGTVSLSAPAGRRAVLKLDAPPAGETVLKLRFRHAGLGYDRVKHLAIGLGTTPQRPEAVATSRSGPGWSLGNFALSGAGDLTGPGGLWIGGPDLALIPRQASRTSGVRLNDPVASIGNATNQGRVVSVTQSSSGLDLHLAYANAEGHLRVDLLADGSLGLSWDFVLSEAFKQWQSGLVLSLPRRFDRLSWRRAGVDDPWPEDHPDRSIGEALAFRPQAGESLPPTWPWVQDQIAEGTNDFRSTKRGIASASLTDANGHGIGVLAEGALSVRAAMAGPVVHLHLLTAADHGSESFLESFAPLTDLGSTERVTGVCRLVALTPRKDIL
mgnify:CR=1 FL=1